MLIFRIRMAEPGRNRKRTVFGAGRFPRAVFHQAQTVGVPPKSRDREDSQRPARQASETSRTSEAHLTDQEREFAERSNDPADEGNTWDTDYTGQGPREW